jgi:hypothetical protein
MEQGDSLGYWELRFREFAFADRHALVQIGATPKFNHTADLRVLCSN